MRTIATHIYNIVLSAVMLLALGGCVADVEVESVDVLGHGEVEHTLVMYLLADNNLSAAIYKNALDAEEGMIGASPATRLVIYLDTTEDSKLYEIRYLPYGGGGEHIRTCKTLKTYPRQTSTTPEVMKMVMEDVRRLVPSRSYGLVMSGHGTGWYPKPISGVGYESQRVAPQAGTEGQAFSFLWSEMPETRHMGYDYALTADGSWSRKEESSYISSSEIVEGLSPIHFDYIIFDACFMSSVEFLYDMRHSADYIVASPVEIYYVGLPYVEIVRSLMSHTSNIFRLGEIAMDVYTRDKEFSSRESLALAMVDCSKLEALADATAAVCASAGAEDCLVLVESRLQKVDEESPYWEGVQPLDRMEPAGFHDLEDFVCALTDSEELEDRFLAALDDAVVWSCHTEDIYSMDIFGGGGDIEYKVGGELDLCGMNTYVPLREAPQTLSYYLQTAWAKKIYGLE